MLQNFCKKKWRNNMENIKINDKEIKNEEDLSKALDSNINSFSYTIDVANAKEEELNSLDTFTEENFYNTNQSHMIHTNAETLDIDLSLTYKGQKTGHILKFKAFRAKDNKISFSYNIMGVYGWLVPMFGFWKTIYYMIRHYALNKDSRKLIQKYLNELIWKSTLKSSFKC